MHLPNQEMKGREQGWGRLSPIYGLLYTAFGQGACHTGQAVRLAGMLGALPMASRSGGSEPAYLSKITVAAFSIVVIVAGKANHPLCPF
jgi:hypothetical protein